MDVVSPPKCSGIEDVVQKLDIWETKVQRLSTRYSEDISDKLKMAIVISVMEKGVQDKIYDKNYENKNLDVGGLKEMLTGLVHQRQQSVKPTAMDLGEVGDGGEEHGWEGGAEEERVDAVKARGKGGCWTCGGNHLQRNCPKEGGNGKGGKKGWKMRLLVMRGKPPTEGLPN